MTLVRKRTGTAVAAAWSMAMCGSFVAGSDHDGPRAGYPQVEIDSLKASLRTDRAEWEITVKYKVETEEMEIGRFDLVFQLWAYGRPLVDAADRPLEFVMPLDRPSEVDDDEIEYKGRFMRILPGDLEVDPHDLRIDALVIDRANERVVKHKEKEVGHENCCCGVSAAGVVSSSFVLAASIVCVCGH